MQPEVKRWENADPWVDDQIDDVPGGARGDSKRRIAGIADVLPLLLAPTKSVVVVDRSTRVDSSFLKFAISTNSMCTQHLPLRCGLLQRLPNLSSSEHCDTMLGGTPGDPGCRKTTKLSGKGKLA
jgi:hypothetical protein